MKKVFFLLFVFFQVMIIHGETYYNSNALGMILKQISPYTKNTYDWVLKRTLKNGIETRILFHNNREINTTTWRENGDNIIVLEFKDSILRKKEIYRGIYLLKEIHYDEAGNTETTVNKWRNNQLLTSDHLKNGHLVYRSTYLIDARGTLKRVIKTASDGGSLNTGFQFSNDRILNEWNSGEDIHSIYRYSKGQITKIESYDSRGIVSSENINRVDGNKKEVVIEYRNGEKVLRKYDNKKRIIFESYSGQGAGRIITYAYKEKKLSEKIIKGPGFREKHLYTYTNGNEVKTETVYRNGELLKQILPGKNGKSEEIIYQNGKPVLKVFYKDNVFVSREPYISSE